MPSTSKPLTQLKIKEEINALADGGAEKKLSDGHGLHLLIRSNGSGRWGYSYRHGGQQKTLTIGRYPDIQPHKARLLHQEARSQVALGNDPAAMKSSEKAKVRQSAAVAKVASTTGLSPTSFRFIAEMWLKAEHALDAPASWKTNGERLKSHVYPRWAGRELVSITKADIMMLTDGLDAAGLSPTAEKVLPLIKSILVYAEDRAERIGLPDGYISPGHTIKRRSRHKTVHHPAITDPKTLADLIHAIRGYGSKHGRAITRYALNLSLLFFMRPGELRSMKWEQIDFENRLLTFTPLKAQPTADPRPITTILSHQSLCLLIELREITGDGEFVFPGHGAEGFMSEATIGNALKRMGFESVMTAQGFRATARTMIRERLKIPIEIIEFQLSHVVADIHGRAYNRAEYIEERSVMMQKWADYLDQISGLGMNDNQTDF